MQFDDWVSNFNTLYYCRIYPQTWSQYCISGGWEGIYSGGAPPKTGNAVFGDKSASQDKTLSPKKTGNLTNITNINTKKGSVLFSPGAMTGNPNASNVGGDIFTFKKSGINASSLKLTLNQMKSTQRGEEVSPLKMTVLGKNTGNILNINTSTMKKSQMMKPPETHSKEFLKRIILNDSEDRWFLNPQYKIEVRYQTKIIITLLQEDEKLSKKLYQKCNFLIIISKNKHARIWDIKDEHIIKKAVEFEE